MCKTRVLANHSRTNQVIHNGTKVAVYTIKEKGYCVFLHIFIAKGLMMMNSFNSLRKRIEDLHKKIRPFPHASRTLPTSNSDRQLF